MIRRSTGLVIPDADVFAELVFEHAARLHGAAAAAAAGVLGNGGEAVAAGLWSQVHGPAILVLLGYPPGTGIQAVLAALLRGPSRAGWQRLRLKVGVWPGRRHVRAATVGLVGAWCAARRRAVLSPDPLLFLIAGGVP